MSQTPSPAPVPALNDPGDETARRYRYQWTWAAIVCCMLLDETQDAEEVFCEHHQDVLIKHRDGTFTGHQVKTRQSDQPVWKAGDEDVRGACARFVQLEAAHPGRFQAYRFLTNHPLHGAENAQSLSYVLAKIAAAPTVADLPSNVRAWLRRVAQEAGCSEALTFQAMSKTTASDTLPKLQDSSMRLVDALTASWPRAGECSHDMVKRAAGALVDACAKASSLEHEQTLPAYLSAITQAAETAIAARVDGKRITATLVGQILEHGLTSTATLSGNLEDCPEPGAGSNDLLLKKLDAGGFSAVSCNSAEDLRDKADYLGIAWTKQHGRAKGLQRYDHVRSVVLSDAGRAFDTTQTTTQRFGPAMREALRRLFEQRRTRGEQLFDCSDDHLEGFAFSLTAQCKVQWSTDRPWEVS